MNTAREIRNIWDEIGRMKGRTAGSLSGAVKTFLGLNDTPAAYAGEALKNVRVNAGANALEFAAGGGGYTPPWQPDAFDGTEDATRSDQFDNSAFDVAKWTKFQDANLTWTEENTWLKITNTGDAAAAFRGFFKVVDSGSFTITAKIGIGVDGIIPASDYVGAGLCVFEDATSNPNTCDLYIDYILAQPSGTAWYCNVQLYSDYDTFSANILSSIIYYLHPVMYQRVTWDETNLKAFLSVDGISWIHVSTYNPSFTPAEFGFINRVKDSVVSGVFHLHWITYHDSDLGIAPCGSP